jgi:hypothetical protein
VRQPQPFHGGLDYIQPIFRLQPELDQAAVMSVVHPPTLQRIPTVPSGGTHSHIGKRLLVGSIVQTFSNQRKVRRLVSAPTGFRIKNHAQPEAYMDPELETIKSMTLQLQQCRARLSSELAKPDVTTTGSNAVIRALNQQIAIREREALQGRPS